MKRSEINAIMRDADAFMRAHGFLLPPFAYWSEADFRKYGEKARGVTSARLGWDITDHGLGNFAKTGLFLFTVRNGNPSFLETGRGMLYAEKIMVIRDGQTCPCHSHAIKTEDIINRGGGTFCIRLHMTDANGKRDENAEVVITTDGLERRLPAGGVLRLAPGESVTLEIGHWHSFWAEDGDVLVGEVSTVNDDDTDNIFYDPIGRFPDIEEDEPPLHLLVGDYQRLGLI